VKFYHNFNQIFSVVKREVKMLFTNFPIFILLFAAPVAYSFIYTCIFTSKLERDVPVIVVDNDRSTASRNLIRHFDIHELIKVDDSYTNINDAYINLQNLKSMALIVIPDNFEKTIKSGKQARISISVNNTRFMITNDIIKAVNDILSEESKNSVVNFFQKKGLGTGEAVLSAAPVVLTTKTLFSTTESYGDFIIVGLLALILLELLLICTAVSMAHENEEKTFNELFHKVSGSVLRLFIGKSLVYLILFAFYAFFYFTFMFQVYKIPFNGSMYALIVLTFVEYIAVVLLGLFIGSFLPSKLISLIVLVFSSYPIFLLSGYSWPIEALPGFLKVCANILPQTWFFKGYTIVTQDGGKLIDIMVYVVRIILIAVFTGMCFFIRIRYMAGKKKNQSV
jgi:ABC-2 type transport system permease protein